MRKEKKEKIAIVGASIGGCATALILQQAHYNVSIYEQRFSNAMVDRGEGIMLPNALLATLIEQGLVDSHFPAKLIKERVHLSYDAKNDKERIITTHPHFAVATHWASLYNSLHNCLPDKIYYNSKVTGVSKDKQVTLTFNHHEEYDFDIVIFADGYFSLGRKFLFPAVRPEFAKYIAWRGTLSRIDAETLAQLAEKVLYYGYDKGHLLIYAIPDVNAENPQKDLLVNWVLYETIDSKHPLTHDYRAQDNITAEAMSKNYIDYLHDMAKKHFPPFARNIVFETEKPYIQAIYDAYIPEYFVENIGVIGDASIVSRPHVGAGAVKALQDALAMQRYVYDTDDLPLALQHWSKIQQHSGNNLLNLGRSLGELLVTKTPEWDKLDQATMDDLWETAVFSPPTA
ncbi:FAD binding domain-containing protein [soil metagenome]